MALLSSCLCCSLLLGSIIGGVYATLVYLAAFIVSVWWIVEAEAGVGDVEEEEGGSGGISVPIPAYLLCLCYLSITGASVWMLVGLYRKRVRVLLAWVFVMTLFCFPEMGMVAFMVFVHWKITSTYGVADLIFYIFRAAFNLLSVVCVQSQYATWRDETVNAQTLKRLEHLHMNTLGKNGVGGGTSHGAREGEGSIDGDPTLSYHNPAFITSPESPTLINTYMPTLTRSHSRASQLSWGDVPAPLPPPPAPLPSVRMGLPGWDPYTTSRDSQSEFNAAAFSPASVGFLPLVSGNSRSEAALYPPDGGLTVYHHNPQVLYPYHHHQIPPPLAHPEHQLYYSTQSLDRRRYVRGMSAGDGINGHAGVLAGVNMGIARESRSSLGAESDDFRRYRDVAL